MKQKYLKATYWGSHLVFAGMMMFSAVMYVTQPGMEAAFQHLGFPSYFRIELAGLKFLGALVLLLPWFPQLKEWAYAGFAITLFSAFVAHLSVGDSPDKVIAPLIFTMILATAYVSRKKLAA